MSFAWTSGSLACPTYVHILRSVNAERWHLTNKYQCRVGLSSCRLLDKAARLYGFLLLSGFSHLIWFFHAFFGVKVVISCDFRVRLFNRQLFGELFGYSRLKYLSSATSRRYVCYAFRRAACGVRIDRVSAVLFSFLYSTEFMFPGPALLDAWLAHSRRQKSRNPENHRAGKRKELECI